MKLSKFHEDYRTDKSKNDKKGKYMCSFKNCEQKYKTKQALNYHILVHKGEKKFICPIKGCNKRFLTKYLFNRHIKKSKTHEVYQEWIKLKK